MDRNRQDRHIGRIAELQLPSSMRGQRLRLADERDDTARALQGIRPVRRSRQREIAERFFERVRRHHQCALTAPRERQQIVNGTRWRTTREKTDVRVEEDPCASVRCGGQTAGDRRRTLPDRTIIGDLEQQGFIAFERQALDDGSRRLGRYASVPSSRSGMVSTGGQSPGDSGVLKC